MLRTLLVIVLAASIPMIALAAPSAPPGTLMMGTIGGDGSSSSTTVLCGVGSGVSSFQRAAATASTLNPPAVIALPDVRYQKTGSSTFESVGGLTTLTFKSEHAGTIALDGGNPKRLPSGLSFPFTGYQQFWKPVQNTLLVKFTIVFPSCRYMTTFLFRAAAP